MAGNPLTDPNWAADVTDTIVETIDKVRSRTTKPIILIARGLVFGLLSAFLGIMALALLLIGVTRALINFIEWPLDHDTAVWVSYFILGGLLCLIGTVCMIKRQSKDGV
jgi:uncharacterized protein YacL